MERALLRQTALLELERAREISLGPYDELRNLGLVSPVPAEALPRRPHCVEGAELELVRADAIVLHAADALERARRVTQRQQKRRFFGIAGLPQHVDRARNARRFDALSLSLFASAAAGERHAQREAQCAPGECLAVHSDDFGGGPIWMRSPKYEPINVNKTPRMLRSTYMNAGMVLTVWPS